MTKSNKTYVPMLLCLAVMGLAGCGGGSSDSVLTGQTTNPAGEIGGCYDLDWAFKPGSSSEVVFRVVSEPASERPFTSTNTVKFVALGTQPSDMFPGGEVFATNTTGLWGRADRVYNEMRRTGPLTFDLAKTVDSYGRSDGFGPRSWATTTFSPILEVTTPALALGQQEVQHRKGRRVHSGTFGILSDVEVDETEFITLTSIETITVEAGRYETCRFEHKSLLTPGVSSTRWVIRGKGVTVKATTTELGKLIRTEEAISVEIDGKRV